MRRVRVGLASTRIAIVGILFLCNPGASAQRPQPAEKSNMELIGSSDLQGRSAYQPLVHKQADRFIAYVGHHGGSTVNSLTGKPEANGTSILDVTSPKQPKKKPTSAASAGARTNAARSRSRSTTSTSTTAATSILAIAPTPACTFSS